MNTRPEIREPGRDYARCIEASKRARWEIDRDVIRGRNFDHARPFLPDELSLADQLDGFTDRQRTLLSQVQGRTYAGMFGLVERFINAKMLELSRDHWLRDQVALEAIVRFSDEELKHQELFRRIEEMIAEGMPGGYSFTADPNEVATVVLGKSTWSVLALTCHIELFTLVHYKASIRGDLGLSPLFKDVFLYHWKEESQHAAIDELEWRRIDAQMSDEQRERGVTDLIDLVVAVDGIVCGQAASDADYFAQICGRQLDDDETRRVRDLLVRAYRYQYILSGADLPRFRSVLAELVTESQLERIGAALDTLRPAA